tara:strand:- start:228 stop:1226 length:999 start_codon:yes stop_codon:yes gene_type:complete
MLVNAMDTRCVAWVALYFALTFVAWRLDLAVLTPVLCYFSFAGACITHNSMHLRTFVCDHTEALWRHALSLTYGHPASTFVPGHNLSHHRHTQSSKDPMRTTKVRYRWNWVNLLMFQPRVAWDVFRMDMRYMALKKHCGEPYFWTCAQEWLVVGLAQMALACLCVRKFVLYVYAPHLFAQWAIVSINLMQHDGCDKTGINNSRNFTGSWVNWLTFNNGFHSIHHQNPTLHWSKLPSAHACHVKGAIHPNLEQSCMLSYMYKAFVWPGKRVDYLGEAVKLDPEDQDEDWTVNHAPEGVTLEDYDVTVTNLAKAVAVMPVKILCPTYSPIFHID